MTRSGFLSLFFCLLVFVKVKAIDTDDDFPYPLHASCELTWSIPLECGEVAELLTAQIEEWTNNECPGVSDHCPELPCGQRCNYRLIEYDADHSVLLAEHRTPVQNYMDNLRFDFVQDTNDCKVFARSYADTFFALYDRSTNYCNLRRLVEGAAIVELDNFEEETSNDVCTEYDVRDCQRY